MWMFSFLAAVPLFALVKALPQASSPNNCVGTISSLNDVSAAVRCKTVNVNGFSVPNEGTLRLDLIDGAKVNVLGDIMFGYNTNNNPLIEIRGNNIAFDGNGKVVNGNGPQYWDGRGLSDSSKPDPMMSIMMSGMVRNLVVVNSPARGVALSASELIVDHVIVDDSQGSYPNERSNGIPAGRNTDGIDISGDDIVVKNSNVINQDDCVAINSGRNILVENNYCGSGHGISVGSIGSDTTVQNVTIRGNTITNSTQAFRIKTKKDATNSRVSNINYVGNVAQNCLSFGVLIDQSYPELLATPGNGVTISDINFSGSENFIQVSSAGQRVAVNCGPHSCDGSWDWNKLDISGGRAGEMNNCPLSGYTL